MCSQIKAACSFIYITVGRRQIQENTGTENAAIPHIIINRCIVMANVAPAVTPRAKDPDKMAKFVTAIKVAIETFDDEIGSLQQVT